MYKKGNNDKVWHQLFSLAGIHVFERHSILVDSIGVFPEEIEAFELVKLMLIIGYSLLVFLTICQVVLYYLYNGKFHPYSKIVMPNRKCKFVALQFFIWILTQLLMSNNFSSRKFECYRWSSQIFTTEPKI